MKKILLIKPCWHYPITKCESTYNRIWPPLSLATCASLLEKEGYNVDILDAHAERIAPSQIGKYLNNCSKIFITSSSLDRWQCPNLVLTPFLAPVKK